jgi:hypothetical protein
MGSSNIKVHLKKKCSDLVNLEIWNIVGYLAVLGSQLAGEQGN